MKVSLVCISIEKFFYGDLIIIVSFGWDVLSMKIFFELVVGKFIRKLEIVD